MCCAGCTAGTVDEGPGLIHSSGGSPGPVGDPASPWRPWTAGRALTDGPGSGSGMAHPTRGGQGHGWSPGSLHGCECCSETRHSGYMLRSFGNRCCVCFFFFFCSVYSISFFLCQTTLFPVSSFLWSWTRSSLLGHVICATGESGPRLVHWPSRQGPPPHHAERVLGLEPLCSQVTFLHQH